MKRSYLWVLCLLLSVMHLAGSAGAEAALLPEDISVSDGIVENDVYVEAGRTETLYAILSPEGAESEVTWTVSDEAIAQIKGSGETAEVTGIAPGETYVTAACPNGVSRDCKVTVCGPVTSVAFDTASVTLLKGEQLQLNALVTMGEQSCVNRMVTFFSNDTSVVLVDELGLVRAVSAGSAEVTAMADNGVSATCCVTVRNGDEPTEPTGVVISDGLVENDVCVEVGSSETVYAILTPDGAASELTWAVSDESLAALTARNDRAVIRGLEPGVTSVTVTLGNGLSCMAQVTVCEPVTSVEFDAAELSLPPKGAYQLTARVAAGDQSFVNRLVSFTSSNPSAVLVDELGLVRAVGSGQATIIASARNGVNAVCTVRVRELRKLVLPSSLTVIEDEAFMNDAGFDLVVLPVGCTSIGDYAFAGERTLLYVKIPDSVTSIGEHAFDDYAGGSHVRIIANEGSYAWSWAVAHGYEISGNVE
ncbi:MAG: Ig-like domain-containing protein [Clostridia bacterium]|nr:Ig-like domain-containing protein [Clostridia bacterium]